MLHKYEQTQQTPYQLHKSCYSKVMIPLSIRGQSLNTRPYKLFLQSQKTIFSEFLITLFWEAVIYNESWRGPFAALCSYSISYLIGAELTFVSLYVLLTSFRLSTSKGLKTKAVTFYLSFYFFATKFQNQKTSDQKYNINFWNQYTEYIFFYLFISYPGQKNTEQVQISRDSAKSSLLFYIADYVVSRWTSRSSSPITYSSLVRHSPKTYSTKWQKTSPGANNFQLSMTAMHQFEQNVHPVQPPPPNPQVSWEWRCKDVWKATVWGEKKNWENVTWRVEASCCQISAQVRYEEYVSDTKIQKDKHPEPSQCQIENMSYYNSWHDNHKIRYITLIPSANRTNEPFFKNYASFINLALWNRAFVFLWWKKIWHVWRKIYIYKK